MAHFLKKLVATLGALIVLALLLMGYGFYKKSTDPSWRLFATSEPTSKFEPRTNQFASENAQPKPDTPKTEKPLTEFGSINLNLAPECSIVKTQWQGRLLSLQTGPKGICESLIIFDSQSGKQLGVIRLR